MKRRLAVSLAVMATLVALSYPTPANARGAGRYIVVLEASVANPRSVAAEHAAVFGAEVTHVYGHALKGYAATIPSARLDALRADSRVAFLSEDRAVWATAQTLPTGVDRIEGDHSSTASGNGSGSISVPVAIIDTGIDLDHPDLNVVGGMNCVRGKPTIDDGNGHGTHVAGTVAAKDDSQGVVGVAPGAPLYAVRVLNKNGSGSWASVICGIDWVTANAASTGIKVANMSLGGSGSDDNNCGNTNNDALHRAICNSVGAGVTYVVAAGNSEANLGGFVPAAYNEVLAVTAMADFNGQSGGGAAPTCRSDVDETAADFSNFATIGSTDAGHTIAAPGVCILSTWKSGGYNTISGTSMASPHGAGAAALCIAGPCAGMTPSQVRERLRNDAAAQPPAYGFVGDPDSPSGNRYYGDLVYAGGY
ncbi:MAG TPA: S8 family serine peptidase [Actinomycetota bacterium]|jgi:subtilisin family serine protease|nr:S8 family serine peptidase [Actinomycetota bacterium]